MNRPALSGAALLAALVCLSPSLQAAKPPKAKKFPADVAVEWFQLLYQRVKADVVPPPRAARHYGASGVALYLALEPGMKKSHRRLEGQLNDLADDAIPKPNNLKKKPLHWPTVANAVLHDVAVDLFAASPASIGEFDALEDALNTGLQAGIGQKTFDRSVAYGQQVAAAVVAWLATDTAYANQSSCPIYTPGSDPQDWQPTPPTSPSPNQPALPCWGDVRPFVLSSSTEVALGPHPAFGTSATTDLFYAQALEVLSSQPTPGSDPEAIAWFWADNAGQTGTPPGHWIDTVRQVVVNEDLDLATAATAYARVGIGVHDAFVATWEYKYIYDLLRPHTYIFNHIDVAWAPLLNTPLFPEYPSGHSTQSGAATVMLEDAFGFAYEYIDTLNTDQNPELLGVPLPVQDRSFESFDQAGREAVVSRLYGGIHFRAGNENGHDLGQAIGLLIREELELLIGEDN